MATNKEAETLKKQISVLSSLIDSHKQLKVKEKDTKNNYSWKISNTKSNLDSNTSQKNTSFQTVKTSKQSNTAFVLDRRKRTLAKPSLVNISSVVPAANSGPFKTNQPIVSKKGKDPLKKCLVASNSALNWQKKSSNDNKDGSSGSTTVNTALARSSADTRTLSARLSSLSSSIASAKLKLQNNINKTNVKDPPTLSSATLTTTTASAPSSKSSDSLLSASSTYTWFKSGSKHRTTSTSKRSVLNSSSALKWTKDGKTDSPIKAMCSGSASVWKAKATLTLDRRKRSYSATKNISTDGFMKRRQKVVQKDIPKKNRSSRYRYINSKRRNSVESKKRGMIEGIPYKVSANKLQKLSLIKTKSLSKKTKQKSSKMLNISGNRYLMDATRKTLKRVQPQNESQPSTSNLLSSRRTSLSHGNRSLLASHVRRRSVQNALLFKYRKKAKAQQYCMFYNRFGKCNKGDNCPYIHDPSKIAVCTKFLQGKCKKTDGSCPFSHKIDKDKLPVCQFFLKDTCTNDNCPYSHVNVSSNAAVCQDFIKGYCPEGQQCKKKHIVDCEEFFQTGKCTKGKKCNLMHRMWKPGKRKRKSSFKDLQQTPKQAKVIMTEEEGFLPLQTLNEPTVKESSATDVKNKDKVHTIAIKPHFKISKDSQG